ncbi:MAG: hypothetical protein ACPGNV_12250 [Mangrovicoccus sp.]
MDTLPVFEAADLCSWLGHLILRAEKGPEFSSYGADAYAQGYAVASLGKGAVTSRLADLQTEGPVPSKNRPGVLGRLYTRLNSKELAAVRPALAAFMREFIIDHWPLGPGDEVFGTPVEKRSVHSITSAAKELGIARSTVDKLVASVEDLSDVQTRPALTHGLYTVDHLAAVKKAVGTLVDADTARRTFGISEPDFASMCRDKLLEPVVGSAAAARWSLETLKRYFDEVEQQACTVDALPSQSDWMRIPDLCRTYKARPAFLLESIRTGRIRNVVHVSGQKAYEGLFLKVEATLLNLLGASQDSIAIKTFASITRMTYPKARCLVDAGIIETEMKRLPGKNWAQRLIAPQELDRFRRRYVSSGELCDRIGETRWTIKTRLQKSNVLPSSVDQKQDAPLFEWTEIEAKLFCRWPRGEGHRDLNQNAGLHQGLACRASTAGVNGIASKRS